MKRHAKKGSGVSVKLLKESWKGSVDAINELEEEGLVLVIRAGKENQPKFVFWNNFSAEQAADQVVDEGSFELRLADHATNLECRIQVHVARSTSSR